MNMNEKVYHDNKTISLSDKIAQMIMIRVRSDYYSSDNYYKKNIDNWIINQKIGGLITFGGSVHGTYYNISRFIQIYL